MLGTLGNTEPEIIMPAVDSLTAYITPVEYTESKLKSTTTTTTTAESMESMCKETIEEMITVKKRGMVGLLDTIYSYAESVIRTHTNENHAYIQMHIKQKPLQIRTQTK